MSLRGMLIIIITENYNSSVDIVCIFRRYVKVNIDFSTKILFAFLHRPLKKNFNS